MPTLNWRPHITTLANRTRSMVKALGVLGNLMQGLSCMAWRHIFSSIILPILTYGSNVWFTDVNQKSYLQVLQVAQNEACQKLTGVFQTTLTHLIQKLLAIPPICFRL